MAQRADTAGRPYRGESAEARRATRRTRLCDATLAELGEGGVPTVRAICRRAELTPRYFYEAFADLDAALSALVDREFDAGVAAVVAAVAAAGEQAPTTARLEAAVEAVLTFVEAVPGRTAVLTGAGALARSARHAWAI